MKAIVQTKYGSPDVLRLEDVEKPAPKDDEVLIRIHAASVTAYDWHFLTADIFLIRFMSGGFFKPKNTRPGADLAMGGGDCRGDGGEQHRQCSHAHHQQVICVISLIGLLHGRLVGLLEGCQHSVAVIQDLLLEQQGLPEQQRAGQLQIALQRQINDAFLNRGGTDAYLTKLIQHPPPGAVHAR